MKHSINELLTLNNYNKQKPLATREFCIKNNIPIITIKQRNRETKWQYETYAIYTPYKENNGRPKKVLDVDGIKLIYLYGEKTYFDTEEELKAYRENGGN